MEHELGPILGLSPLLRFTPMEHELGPILGLSPLLRFTPMEHELGAMHQTIFKHGKWEAHCTAADGARVGLLRYNGHNLLTTAPDDFRPPADDLGRYETRPVYGYDDCLPTVEACEHPTIDNLTLADHGEVCYLPWQVETEADRIVCKTRCDLLGLDVSRTMIFEGTSLHWQFEVKNVGDRQASFLHVMHPLMPLDDIEAITFPTCKQHHDLIDDKPLAQTVSTPAEAAAYLLDCPKGEAREILLQGVDDGRAVVTLRGGLSVEILFDKDLLPTMGIWWNNSAYPDEKGLRRNEAAFEPYPSTFSNLARAHKSGKYMSLQPEQSQTWTITWRVSK